jgi:hypothetical protein
MARTVLTRKDLQMKRCSTTFQKDIVAIDIFEKIKASGGWPDEYNHIGYEHTDERNCFFSKREMRDGMHTSVFSKDEYYWHCLSEDFKATKIKKAVVKFANSMMNLAYSHGDE